MPTHTISPAQPLDLATLAALLADGRPVVLGTDAKAQIARQEAPVYGEGPAPGARRPIDSLASCAYGTGAEAPPTLVRLMLLLTVQQAVGQSTGLAVATVERLLAFYNRELLPVVLEQGGDAAATAHLALPLLGEGEVNYQGYRLAAADALSLFSWAPLALRAGEAAALRRGAPFTLAYAVDAVLRAQRLARATEAVRALAAAVPGEIDAEPADYLGALAPVARAVDAALHHPTAPLAPALGQLGAAVAALGRASAGRTARVSGAPGAGPAATALGAHAQAVSPFIAAAAEPYAALQARQLVETAEQLLGMELLAVAQALEAGAPASPTGAGAALLAAFRAAVPVGGPGQAPYPALRLAAGFVRSHPWAA